MHADKTPRSPVVAGRFYPGQAGALRAQVEEFLVLASKAPPLPEGASVLAAMAPHAGYVFSGAVAGLTLGQARLAGVDTVILLGPNHTGRGVPLSVWDGGPWLTPLGAVPVAETVIDELLQGQAGFTGNKTAHVHEHSLEVLLPFLQVLRPEARVAAVTVSLGDPTALRLAGEELAACIQRGQERGERIRLVVSSDMSHYLPHEKAKSLDALALEKILALDPEGVYQTVRAKNISMCGVLPMVLALFACQALGARETRLTAYATSGQTGRAYGADMESVVGYAGVLIFA